MTDSIKLMTCNIQRKAAIASCRAKKGDIMNATILYNQAVQETIDLIFKLDSTTTTNLNEIQKDKWSHLAQSSLNSTKKTIENI